MKISHSWVAYLTVPVALFGAIVLSQFQQPLAKVETKQREGNTIQLNSSESPQSITEEEKIPQPVPVEIQTQEKNIEKSQSHTSGVEQWKSLVSRHFPSSAVNTVLNIMREESGGNQYAKNLNDRHRKADGTYCTGSYGLMQIACLDGIVYDPDQNMAIARRKWDSRGWIPWKNTAIKLGLI